MTITIFRPISSWYKARCTKYLLISSSRICNLELNVISFMLITTREKCCTWALHACSDACDIFLSSKGSWLMIDIHNNKYYDYDNLVGDFHNHFTNILYLTLNILFICKVIFLIIQNQMHNNKFFLSVLDFIPPQGTWTIAPLISKYTNIYIYSFNKESFIFTFILRSFCHDSSFTTEYSMLNIEQKFTVRLLKPGLPKQISK